MIPVISLFLRIFVNGMDQLNIIHASAGSGKTHSLAGFFLELILPENLDYFKSILGVTFTNKATGEMKRRIIEQLYQLSENDNSVFQERFLPYFRYNRELLNSKANIILRKILHEYSWFSIETIDTFFQRVIRAFTRELGIPGNYSVEIDTKPVLNYAVDQLLDTLGDNSELLNWLLRFSENKIDEGKSWDIHRDLIELGNQIFREEFAAGSLMFHEVLGDREKLRAYGDTLFSTITNIAKHCKEFGEKGLEVIRNNGLTADDFYQKRNGPVKFFSRLEQGELKNSQGELFIHTSLVAKLLEDPANWPSSDTKQKSEVINLASGILQPLLSEITDYIEKNYRLYYTAEVISKNLYSLGILTDLEEKIRQYRLEKNVFILNDAPKLLDRIINQNDTPFIYEKMGNRYGHFLIDEFQDTSKLQWNNFKPLISNSLSQGKSCQIVGDVKQSIYRWRNGDWNILAREIYNEYPPEVLHDENLGTNWRSTENIIRFNNGLFPVAQKLLGEQWQLITGEKNDFVNLNLELLQHIYSDISQNVPEHNSNKGNVNLRFFSKQTVKEQPDYYIRPLIESINSLLKKGYKPGDIALLVRNKREGKVLADLLIASNNESKFSIPVEVISDESLFLSASYAVNILIAALQCLDSPDESLYQAKLLGLYKSHISDTELYGEIVEMKMDTGFFRKQKVENLLPSGFADRSVELSSLPLYELTEQLTGIFQLYRHKADIPYIHALLDLIYEYSQKYPPDIKGFLDYWTDEGSTKSIPAVESTRSVRILTIHKSKGLEFNAVIIPFCSWELNQKTNAVFWTGSPEKPFDVLPLVPVNFTRTLKDTLFAKDYYDEMFKSYIDNLNLLYVALTRPKETLVAFPVYNNSGKGSMQLNTVGDLLYECLKTDLKENFEYRIESSGSVILHAQQVAPVNNIISSYTAKPATGRMFFNTYGYDYFQDITQISNKRIRGRVLHNLLSGIVVLDDLEATVQKFILEGLISDDEGQLLEEHIRMGMNDEIVVSWFDGSGEVLTERDILLPGEHVKRPDRVVIWPDRVHVVDYKFSRDTDKNSYQRQVKDYMNLVREITGKTVKGFLWYVDKNERIEIGK